jgi:hypothetical protein
MELARPRRLRKCKPPRMDGVDFSRFRWLVLGRKGPVFLDVAQDYVRDQNDLQWPSGDIPCAKRSLGKGG